LRAIFEAPKLAGFAQLVEAARANQPLPVPAAVDWAAECALEPDVRPAGPPPAGEPQTILLTGATGFLGVYLAHKLAARTSAQIVCLIRADDDAQAANRLDAALARYRVTLSAGQRGRLHALAADLAAPGLRLPSERWRALATGVGAIYHCASNVDFLATYRMLRQANVDGTRELLRLATAARAIPFHYISSISAAADGHGSPVHEGLTSEAPAGGYGQSKWVAEHLVAEAGRRGLPVAIYRPGRITGARDTGVFNPTDLLIATLKGCLQLGMLPDVGPVEMIPVDFVAEAIVGLGTATSAPSGAIYNLVGRGGVSGAQMYDILRRHGLSVSLARPEVWLQELHARCTPDNALHRFAPLFPRELPDVATLGGELAVEADRTVARLASLGLSCPPARPELFEHYLEAFVRDGYLAD
jgi:thioester reductase-like protein